MVPAVDSADSEVDAGIEHDLAHLVGRSRATGTGGRRGRWIGRGRATR
jgi:hypothetical protein